MKLNYSRTFFLGLAFLSISSFWILYDNIIPLILSNTFNLDETITGVIMAADNLLALFLLPIFGALSDKVNTKLGKRTPFILVGTILAIIFMFFLPIADNNGNFILFFISLGAVLLSMSIYRSPAVALMPDLTPKPLRSKANSIINLMGALGAIMTLLLIKFFVPKTDNPDYTIIFLCVSAIMAIAVVVLLLTIKENKLAKEVLELDSKDNLIQGKKEEKKSISLDKNIKRSLIFLLLSIFLWFTAYNAVTTAFSRYAVKVWGLSGGGFADPLMVATGAAILSYLPIGIVASKIGRKKTILFGITLMTISYLFAFTFTEYTSLINIVLACVGIGWASISVNSYPMVVEMSRHGDVGKYTGLYYTFSMSAQIFTPILSGFFLENVSYRILFPYAVIFSFASFCTMIMVKHGDSKPEKKKSTLDNFDLED